MNIYRPLLIFVVTASLATGCSDEATVVHEESTPKYSASQFFETTSYSTVPSGGYAFSPDGNFVLVSSDESGVVNIYSLPIAGGEAQQLTHSEDVAIRARSFFPDDLRVLYTFDGEGDEKNHILVRETDGSVTDLTPGTEHKAEFVRWSNDGTSFYIMSTERDGQFFDLYRYSTADYSRELAFENPGMALDDVSADGRWVALGKDPQSATADVYVVDLESDDREPIQVTIDEDVAKQNAIRFTPDSRGLVYSTEEHGEFTQAWIYDLETGGKTALVTADWDVYDVRFSPAGTFQVSSVNADARTVASIENRDTGESVALPELPPGDLYNIHFSADESKLLVTLNADNSPSDLYVIELENNSATQLTQALTPTIDPDHLVVSNVIRYESFDGLEIPGILYKPKGASAENPVPAIVQVHGGPGGQSRSTYSPTYQFLVNQGYAVLRANNRGSSGYGKTFFHMDDLRHGTEDLQDIVYARKYLESLDWVDSDAIGVMGGSYGGYMVAAALTFHPEVFDVGINIFGVTNWPRTIESTPAWWASIRDWLHTEIGHPVDDLERLRSISPLFHADNIVKPLLVVQGANDPRVLQVESDELVAVVRANEVPVEYIVFPDEGHGFSKKVNQITAAEAYLQFLDTYLASR